ncbi:MAG: neutral/alkaline non-lysosomal ceramidase N-terminal domain-containing protein, partial [Perlucidibaca sp.]
MFVSDDHAFPSGLLRQEVLGRIAADPALASYYGPDNVMLSATHTHAATGGFGDPAPLPALPAGTPQALVDVYAGVQGAVVSPTPFDRDNFNAIAGGIVQAIRRAHANLQAHPEMAPIRLSSGELLNANRNRDPLAYRQNSPAERARYRNVNGREVPVNKRFLQLSMMRGNGSAVGVLNWFGVHPTAMGNHNRLISSDSKGYASLGFERLMGTRYEPDATGRPSGADNFVAAFAQTDEGNAMHDLYVFDKDTSGNDGPGQGVPYRFRFGTDDPFDFDQPGYERGMRKATAIFGTKQLAQALRQYGQGDALTGPVDYRLFHVDMSAVEVKDAVVLDGLSFPDLPSNLYAGAKSTCGGGSGLGFLGGAPNGFGVLASGYACMNSAPAPYLDDARNHYNGMFNGSGSVSIIRGDLTLDVPLPGMVAPTVSALLAPVLCLQNLQPKWSCQAEKPTVADFPVKDPAPFQLFRVGNLAVLGLPWEVTAMAARRLRRIVLDTLAPAGVDTVVIAGLTNNYLNYMTTREEYSAQMYEGGSTPFGPWQLAAVQQESRRLALAMA